MYIEKINSPKDLRKLSVKNLNVLAKEIRELILKKTSKVGGHVGSNLGVVELTIAVHYVFDAPKDKIVFDASHQTYTHKILTGRKNAFINESNYKNVKRFSDPNESEFDLFKLGHTSSSLSLANGLARARDLMGTKERVVAIIGDGALSGGQAYEGLNNISETGTNTIVILNDNNMSIAENHGGVYNHFNALRKRNGKIKGNIFQNLGFEYYYISDGHNLKKLINILEKIKDINKPVLLHVCTQKGKGYIPAETNKETFHSGGGFDLYSGKHKIEKDREYFEITNKFLLEKMKQNKNLVYISSGTPTMLGVDAKKRDEMGNRFIDVGICEGHAVSMLAGLSKNGCSAVYGVFGTFLQRGYDQVVEDLCLNKIPSTILLFKSSVFGMTSATHLGIFDNTMLSSLPNLIMLAPTCVEEYLMMLNWSIKQKESTVVIKVPCPKLLHRKIACIDSTNIRHFEVERAGENVVIIGVGKMFKMAQDICDNLKKYKVFATLINPRCISSIDEEFLNLLKNKHRLVITIEDAVIDGGFGQKISSFYSTSDMIVKNYGITKSFPDEYDPVLLLDENGISKDKITKDILSLLNK